MSPSDIEKLVLGTCLAHPNGTANIPQQVVYELDPSRIGDPANSQVYFAIKSCVQKNLPPTPANVALEMNGTLEAAGGMEYVESLPRLLSDMGGYDPSGIREWVRRVDINGRARLIYQTLSKKTNMSVDEFQKQVSKADDPDAYLSQIFSDANMYVSGTKSDYRPISDAVEIFDEQVKASLRGEVTDIIPCGIPNLEKYCIPRPRSFGVVAGISGQGKTQFVWYIGLGVAIGLQKRGERGQVVINTLEEQGSDLVMRGACMMAQVNSLDIARCTLTKAQADRLFEKSSYINSLPIVYNDDSTITSSQFVTHAICQHMKVPRILGICDYVELLTDKAESEELKVSRATRNIRSLCWQTGSCEIMLVQLNDDAIKSSYKTGGMFASRNSRAPAHAADWWIEVLNYPELKKAQIKATVAEGRNENLAYALIEKGRKYGKGEEAFEWVAEHTMFRDISLPIGQLYGEIKEDDF